MECEMDRKAIAEWRGTGRDGSGTLSTGSGALSKLPYSYGTRFGTQVGANPEELLGAAHAGCFTMAVAFALQIAGYTPTQLTTEAVVTIEVESGQYRISRSALALRAVVPKLDEASFQRIASDAAKTCPVSKVLRAEVTLDAHLSGGGPTQA
jgi:osmotically inducible protein OsmC